jgi:hypothetical protein
MFGRGENRTQTRPPTNLDEPVLQVYHATLILASLGGGLYLSLHHTVLARSCHSP